MLKPLTHKPIDPTTVAVVRELGDAAEKFGIDLFLVGAAARSILLEHVHGLSPGRATRDVDFAFAVDNWEHFQAIKNCLLATGRFRALEKLAQRLKYKIEGFASELTVDLIPFGGIESEGRTLRWPPDMATVMNVAGYDDAYHAAVPVEIAPGLVLRVASLPAMAILKIFAWGDRGRQDHKDALDLLTLLRQYCEAGNETRIHEDFSAVLEATEYDIKLAGARLLGLDAKATSSPDTLHRVMQIFDDEKNIERLLTDMSKALRGRDNAYEIASGLLAQFIAGLR